MPEWRKALIVGIDYYETIGSLYGCVNDARAVKAVLERHGNAGADMNFATPQLLVAPASNQVVTKKALRDAVGELFADDADIALFYFAGHGYVDDTGGFLCASDSEGGDDGLALADVMTRANNSKARNKIIILDSCHSGQAGNRSTQPTVSEIADGVTILTASTATQYAEEDNGSGLFTGLLVDALKGAAANLVGDITPGSVYAHIDQSLGPWVQRPVFKTSVKKFVSLRNVVPPIPKEDLRAITTYFPTPDYDFKLDPSYEPERSSDQLNNPEIPPPDPDNNAVFGILQKYVRVNLVEPVGAKSMWHSAMHRKSCRLTALGRHYWNLVRKELI
jgi:hypothetical protein